MPRSMGGIMRGLLLGLLLTIPTAANAAPGEYYASSAKTAMLAQICHEGVNEPLHADLCSGYAMATYDALSYSGAICPGEGGGSYQLMAVARKYLADHPEEWSKSPFFVISESFKAAFPCR